MILDEGIDFLSSFAGKSAASALNAVGYRPRLLGSDITVSYRNNQVRTVTLGGIAYTEEDTMLEHASIVVHPIQNHDCGPEAVEVLDVLSAPFFLLYSFREETFRFWAAGAEPGGARKVWDALEVELPPNELLKILPQYAEDLSPRKVADVKAGRSRFSTPAFARLDALQLQFFADNATRETLVKHFAHALGDLQKGFNLDRAAQLAVQLLAWRVLVDRKGFSTWEFPGVIPDEAKKQNIAGYFDWTPLELENQTFATAATLISRLNYSGFNVDFLRGIYHEAFDKALAKKFGRFDTPLWLTRALIERIPFELLPPKDRNLVDLTCGWGSFLVATHERFRAMPDMPSGQALTSQIRGNELEPLTAGLARFAMLLTSGHNTWKVDNGDALEWKPPQPWEVFSIVGNPPYGAPKEGHSRKEDAYKFLAYACEYLPVGGFLSLVLPASFMSAQKGNDLRRTLLEQFELFELWQLPIGVFDNASERTVAFVAQRKAIPVSHPVRVGLSLPTPKALALLKANIFSSAVVDVPHRWKDIRLEARGRLPSTTVISPSVILPEQAWSRFRQRTLVQICDVCYGMVKGNPSKKPNRFAPIVPEERMFLHQNHVAVRPFSVSVNGSTPIRYPHDLEEPGFTGHRGRPSKGAQMQRPKVVTPNTLIEDWGQMIAGGIDRTGTYFSNNFYCLSVGPEFAAEGITVEYIAAIINWWVATAWVGEHRQMLYLRSGTMEGMPVPVSPPAHLIEQITLCVRRIEDGVDSPQSLDPMMAEAYGLTVGDPIYHRLKTVFYWKREEQAPVESSNFRTLSVAGKVEAVDLANQSIALWTDINDSVVLPLDSNLPGWMLRPDAIFVGRGEVDGEGKLRRLINVSPDPHSYLSADEVSEHLAQALKSQNQ